MNLEDIKFRFLKNISGLKPFLVLIILIGSFFGYKETERVWANLGYISGDDFQNDFDSVFDATTSHLKFNRHKRDSAWNAIQKRTRSWPISLLTKLVFDTLTNSGVIVHSDSTKVKYRYSDELIFDKETNRFTRQFKIAIQDSLLPQVVTMIKQEIDSLNTLKKGELVSFKIIAWTDTDEAIVKFKDY